MKNLKFSLFSFLTIFAIALLMTSCGKEEIETVQATSEEENIVSSDDISYSLLTEEDIILVNLKESQSVKEYNEKMASEFGALSFEESYLAKNDHLEEDFQIILTPINSVNLFMVSTFDETTNSFKSIIMEISPEGEKESDSFSGKQAIYLPDGSNIYTQIFKDGIVVSEYQDSNLRADWGCIVGCLVGAGVMSAGWWVCRLCRIAPSWFTCLPCVGGNAYYLTLCIWMGC